MCRDESSPSRWAAISTAMLSMLAISSLVQAADSEHASKTFSVSIDRQPMAGALQQLARQCDVQMIFFSRVTEGLSAPAMEGSYTLPAAMERLLAGSGLTFTVISPQTVEVRPLHARASGSATRASPTGVAAPKSSSGPAGPLEEVIVVGLAEQLVATRIATPLHDIPQSISLVTGEHMRVRNEFDLASVLDHTPGITVDRISSLHQNFYARGYQITSFHIDGGAAVIPNLDPSGQSNQLYLGTPDLIEFDHIEILRGADGLFTGNGNPGGTISLVRKRPQRHFDLAVKADAGSWDEGRVAIDITGPIALDGSLRGRAAVLYAQQGYFYDIDPQERKKIFGALEYEVNDSATITAGGSYQWDSAHGGADGVPWYADGRDSRLPRDTAMPFDWEQYDSELGGVYLQYRRALAQDWSLKLNGAAWRTKGEIALGEFGAIAEPIDPFTNEMNAWPDASFSVAPNVHEQRTVDFTLSGTLHWFGLREEIALGADFTRVEISADAEGYFAFGERLRHPLAFDPKRYPDPRLAGPADFGVTTRVAAESYGAFASLRVYFDDSWSLLGGARFSNDDSDTRLNVHFDSASQALDSRSGSDHVLTPHAALVYAIDPRYSLYASYSEIYLSQRGRPERAPGTLLEPVRGVNAEAGVKAAWRNGALNGSLALFWIEQRNLARDAPNPCCSIGVTSKSHGLDVEISGEVMAGWRAGAGYTFNENESPEGGALSSITPKHLLKAWTNVQLRGWSERWEIGGTIHAQSKARSRNYQRCLFECVQLSIAQPAYAVVGLRTGYEISDNWRAALSVNNVFDKRYYEAIDVPQLNAWYGEPRNWMLTIEGRY